MFGLFSKDKDKETGSSKVYGKCDPLRDMSCDDMLYVLHPQTIIFNQSSQCKVIKNMK